MAENASCSPPSPEGYDTSLQIGGLFAVLGASLIGACIPLLIRKIVSPDVSLKFLGVFKMFGAGVLVSTSLIHMFVPSVEFLTNECLSEVFKDYEGWAGAIATAGILVGNAIQLLSAKLMKNAPSSPTLNTESKMEEDALSHAGHSHGFANSREDLTIGVYVLEAGIFAHSIIIGLALGTTTSTSEYVPLLIALCFHQAFEGMALSSLVAEIFHNNRAKTIMMTAVYVLSTPLGIFIGIMIYSGYNPDAFSALVTQGILESFAAGLLLYDAIANIIVPFFSSNSFKKGSDLFQLGTVASLWMGALAMAIIGKWA